MKFTTAQIILAFAATSIATSLSTCSDICSTLASDCARLAPVGSDAAERCTNLVNNCNIFCADNPQGVPNFLGAINDLIPGHLQTRQVFPLCDCADVCSKVTAECVVRFGKDSTYCHTQLGRCQEYCITDPCARPEVVNNGVTVVIPPAVIAANISTVNKTLEVASEAKPKCCYELCQPHRPCSAHPRPFECAAQQAKCLAACHDIGCPHPGPSDEATPKVLPVPIKPSNDATPKVLPVPIKPSASDDATPKVSNPIPTIKPSDATPKTPDPISAAKVEHESRQVHSEQCQEVCNIACTYQQTYCEEHGGLACEAQFPGCIPQCLAAYCPVKRSLPVEVNKPAVHVEKRQKYEPVGCVKCMDECDVMGSRCYGDGKTDDAVCTQLWGYCILFCRQNEQC